MDTLVLNIGMGSAAGSTPLWLTLNKDNKIVHTGHFKEPRYLSALENADSSIRPAFVKKAKIPYRCNGQNMHNGEWTQEEWEEFFYSDWSIEKYIRYYKRVKEKTGFPMVGDFTNRNCLLTTEFLEQYKPALEAEFKIKVLMVVRDPIRRWWSECNSIAMGKKVEKEFLGPLLDTAFYAEIYRKWRDVFPDIHVLIMEDFSSGHSKELSEFLGHEIKNIHRNCYWPEMDVNIPHYPELRDQWRNNGQPIKLQPLTDEIVEKGKKCFEWIYEDCHAEGIYPKYALNSWYM